MIGRILAALIACLSPNIMACQQVPNPIINEKLVVDGNHLKYMPSGKPAFLVGPGDPEGMLYFTDIKNSGTMSNAATNGDFSLDDQVSYLIDRGARMVYIHAYWNEPSLVNGETKPFHPGTPGSQSFNNRLNKWDSIIEQLNAAGITVTFFMFDDADNFGSNDYDTPSHNSLIPGNDLDAITLIVNKLKHHKLLIWGTMEEADKIFSSGYDNPPSTSDMKSYINKIKSLDPDHAVGMHQQGNTFSNKFPVDQGYNHNMFMLQQPNSLSMNDLRSNVMSAVLNNQHLVVNLAEIQSGGTWHGQNSVTGVRQRNWAGAMGGASVVQILGMGYMNAIRNTESQRKYNDASNLMGFMQMTNFNELSPTTGQEIDNTKWILSNSNSAILYATANGTMGIRGDFSGSYKLIWMDIKSGKIQTSIQVLKAGLRNHYFNPPSCITGSEVAMWMAPNDLGFLPAIYLLLLDE